MSAFENFLNVVFPEVAQRRHQQRLRALQSNIQESLSAFGPQETSSLQQFQAETFGPEDPLQQLQAQGQSGLATQVVSERPGLFTQPQIKALSGLMANPATREFGQALLKASIPKQTDISEMFGKINPKDFTSESIGAFQSTGDFSTLVPVDKEGAAKDFETRFKNAKVLRGEFTNVTKNFAEINDAFGRIRVSANQPDAAGDLSLLFNYMKMLDPESVVRESEFAAAAQAGSYGQRMQGFVNRIMSGQRLAPSQRSQFVNRARMLFQEASRVHQGRVKEFTEKAQRFGLDPQDVIFQRQFQPIEQPTGQPAKRIEDMTDEELRAIAGGG